MLYDLIFTYFTHNFKWIKTLYIIMQNSKQNIYKF